MIFVDSFGEQVDIVQEITKFCNDDYENKIFLGTDSQIHKDEKCVVYVTVAVLYKKGKGGRFFLSKKKGKMTNSLLDRLSHETWRSVQTAMDLSQVVPKSAEIIIHMDVNKSKKFKSGNYTEQLVGMVTSQGFKCFVKPDSWAATTIADRFSK